MRAWRLETIWEFLDVVAYTNKHFEATALGLWDIAIAIDRLETHLFWQLFYAQEMFTMDHQGNALRHLHCGE